VTSRRWAVAVVAGGVADGLLAARSPIAALGAGLALAVALAVWRLPGLGAAIVLGLVPAIAGVRRGLPLPGARPSEVAVAVVGAVVLWRLRGPRFDRVDAIVAAYAAASFLLGAFDLVLVRGDPVSAAALQTLGAPLGLLLVYRLCRVACADERWLVLGLRLALLAVPLVAASAVAQEVGLGSARRLLARLTAGDDYGPFGAMLDQGVARATGPFEHPQTLGAYLMVATVLATVLLVREQAVLPRRVLLGVLVAAAAGLAATVTAAPAIAAAVGALVVGVRAGHGRRAAVVGGALAVIAAIAVAPRIAGRLRLQFDASGSLVPQSLRFRLAIWRDQYLPSVRGHWITGFGPGFPLRITFPYSESLYVGLVFRGGILLLAAYAVLLIVVVRAVLARGALAGARGIAAEAFLVVTALLVPLHLIGSYWLDGGVAQLWWALLGCALSQGDRATSANLGRV
jgi:hypothetical protein